MSASTLLKLALLIDDDLPFVFAAQRRLERKSSKLHDGIKFDFELLDDTRCKKDFRFHKTDIPRLQRVLGIPAVMRTSNRIKFTGLEGLCILLRRLAYPQRLSDLQLMFGRSTKALSAIFNMVLNFLYRNHVHLISSLDKWWMEPRALLDYCHAIRRKGCPLARCFGFIDGTIHSICRPIKHQREFYSGHKRVHGIKYQSVVLPNGIIAHFSGIIPGRRHDSYMLEASGLIQQLEDLLGAEEFYLFGDSGYPLKRFLIKPYLGNRLSAAQLQFNRTMSELRVAVEWEFSDLFRNFAFLDFKKNQKVYLQPVAKYIMVATLLKNCKTCLYGSESSSYFNVATPTLENYIHNIPE